MKKLEFRIILSVLLAFIFYIPLGAGNYIARNIEDELLKSLVSEIIPIIYVLSAYYIVKRYKLISNNFFEDTNIKFKASKTLLTGTLCLTLPLYFSFLSSVIPFIGKKADFYIIRLVLLFIFCLCIGIIEEILFRGIIFRILILDNSKTSLFMSVALSSILFGMMHLGNLTMNEKMLVTVTTQVVYTEFLGVLFAALYLRFKSLTGIIILHTLIDFISYYPKIFDMGVSSVNDVFDISLNAAAVTISVFLPSLFLSIIILYLFCKKYYK